MDKVDFDVVDADGTVREAVQVKSRVAGGSMSGALALGVLLDMVNGSQEAGRYLLLTNARPGVKGERLGEVLSEGLTPHLLLDTLLELFHTTRRGCSCRCRGNPCSPPTSTTPTGSRSGTAPRSVRPGRGTSGGPGLRCRAVEEMAGEDIYRLRHWHKAKLDEPGDIPRVAVEERIVGYLQRVREKEVVGAGLWTPPFPTPLPDDLATSPSPLFSGLPTLEYQ